MRLKAGMAVRTSAKVVTDSSPQENVYQSEKPVSSKNKAMVNSFVSDGIQPEISQFQDLKIYWKIKRLQKEST